MGPIDWEIRVIPGGEIKGDTIRVECYEAGDLVQIVERRIADDLRVFDCISQIVESTLRSWDE